MNLETDDPEKGELLQRSAHHRELLEEEVKAITERSGQIVTNALIIGGALTLTYILVSSFSGKRKKTKKRQQKLSLVQAKEDERAVESDAPPEEAGVVSQIGAMLVAQATGFLLNIAREKLVEFIQAQSIKKENANERS